MPGSVAPDLGHGPVRRWKWPTSSAGSARSIAAATGTDAPSGNHREHRGHRARPQVVDGATSRNCRSASRKRVSFRLCGLRGLCGEYPPAAERVGPQRAAGLGSGEQDGRVSDPVRSRCAPSAGIVHGSCAFRTRHHGKKGCAPAKPKARRLKAWSLGADGSPDGRDSRVNPLPPRLFRPGALPIRAVIIRIDIERPKLLASPPPSAGSDPLTTRPRSHSACGLLPYSFWDTSRGSLKGKRKRAAWNTNFLEKLLFG